MDCIKGAASANAALSTVWCSGGWNYSYALLVATADNYPTQFVTSGYAYDPLGGLAAVDQTGV